jgi:hypothetical protein
VGVAPAGPGTSDWERLYALERRWRDLLGEDCGEPIYGTWQGMDDADRHESVMGYMRNTHRDAHDEIRHEYDAPADAVLILTGTDGEVMGGSDAESGTWPLGVPMPPARAEALFRGLAEEGRVPHLGHRVKFVSTNEIQEVTWRGPTPRSRRW